MKEHPARRAHDDMRMVIKGLELQLWVNPTKQDSSLKPEPSPQRPKMFGNLEAEFAGGREDNPDIALGLVQQMLHHGQGEGQGLAAAGLRQRDYVAALQREGQGLALDLGRGLVAQSLAGVD
jgi:hypothetical protein